MSQPDHDATQVAMRSGPAFVGTRAQPQQNLADILERVLDKGIVIVGDVQIRLLDIELLTIKIRLMVASVERAREMGINWWEGDPFVSRPDPGALGDGDVPRELERRVKALEERVSEQQPPERETPGQAAGSPRGSSRDG